MKMKETLVSTALKLFIEQGYNQVSLRDLAAAVDIKQASIYYHFEDKLTLFRACADLFFLKWQDWLSSDLMETDALEDTIRSICHSLGMDETLVLGLYGAQSKVGQYRFILDVLANCPESMQGMKAANTAFLQLISYQVDEAREKGLIRADVSAETIYLLLSSLIEGSNIMRFTDEDFDIQAESDKFFQIIWQGIKANP